MYPVARRSIHACRAAAWMASTLAMAPLPTSPQANFLLSGCSTRTVEEGERGEEDGEGQRERRKKRREKKKKKKRGKEER